MVVIFYTLLFLSVALLWLPGFKWMPTWLIALVAALALGLFCAQLELIALIPVLVLGLALIIYENTNHSALRIMAGLIALLVGAGLMTHLFPGFHNLKIIDGVKYSKDAIPFTQYLNIDKTIAGILILGLSLPLIRSKQEWKRLFRQLSWRVPVVVCIAIVIPYQLGFANFDIKFPAGLFIWAITNLLFVCMAEEAYFRGFIQKNLTVMMQKTRGGNILAIIFASILFGLGHYAGGIHYILLASVVGAGFGWIYAATRRIEGGILSHFAFNLTHFIFFTYPALA